MWCLSVDNCWASITSVASIRTRKDSCGSFNWPQGDCWQRLYNSAYVLETDGHLSSYFRLDVSEYWILWARESVKDLRKQFPAVSSQCFGISVRRSHVQKHAWFLLGLCELRHKSHRKHKIKNSPFKSFCRSFSIGYKPPLWLNDFLADAPSTSNSLFQKLVLLLRACEARYCFLRSSLQSNMWLDWESLLLLIKIPSFGALPSNDGYSKTHISKCLPLRWLQHSFRSETYTVNRVSFYQLAWAVSYIFLLACNCHTFLWNSWIDVMIVPFEAQTWMIVNVISKPFASMWQLARQSKAGLDPKVNTAANINEDCDTSEVVEADACRKLYLCRVYTEQLYIGIIFEFQIWAFA